jgi:cohesin complex subunit SCC1
MFYSETLLSKTGPLARVWLSANLERKLSKSHILQSNIESSVNAIVDQGQAPMALRLSGQLLLGVVRIYSRKTRYLLDDCNEALMKIKMVCLAPARPRVYTSPSCGSMLTPIARHFD